MCYIITSQDIQKMVKILLKLGYSSTSLNGVSVFREGKKVIKNNSTITLQVANMDDELITSIDTDGKDSVGITQDGYKVFVNGKLLGIENSSNNE